MKEVNWLEENLSVAVKAAFLAGKEIMRVYNRDFAVENKNDNSPLTEADKKANDIINDLLNHTGIPIISEENTNVEYKERKDWEYCWVVDPLDGTKEFIKRNDEFTVNIALIKEGVPILGVVYVPVFGLMYTGNTEAGKVFKKDFTGVEAHDGDFMNDATHLEGKNSRKEIDTHYKKLRVVGSRSHMNQETLNYIKEYNTNRLPLEVIPKGSSLKFCSVLEGSADLYPRLAPTMEWDTAAAHAICNAGGISVKSLVTGKELRYNKESLLNPWFVCE